MLSSPQPDWQLEEKERALVASRRGRVERERSAELFERIRRGMIQADSGGKGNFGGWGVGGKEHV